jgi:predicted acetyltransferase
MIIKSPEDRHIPNLRQLWQQAFGDSNETLDAFFATGFSPDRCHYLMENDTVVSALYWFDCQLNGQKLAYLYAVATDEKYRGRGLCRALMENTHSHLLEQGYAAAVLVPGTENLFCLYEKMGYATFGYVWEFTCKAENAPVQLQKLTAAEYAQKRKALGKFWNDGLRTTLRINPG